MAITVKVAMTYRRWCPECLKKVEQTVSAAIRDAQVTGLSISISEKCEHETVGQMLSGKGAGHASVVAPLPGQQGLPGVGQDQYTREVN